MERESNSMQAYCRSGCGFYGNPATDGLCSLCYKEALKKKQQPPSSSSAASFSSSAAAPPTQPSLMDTHTAVPTIPVISPSPINAASSADNKDIMSDDTNKQTPNPEQTTPSTTQNETPDTNGTNTADSQQTPADATTSSAHVTPPSTNASLIIPRKKTDGEAAGSSSADSGADLEDSIDNKDDKDAKKKKNRCVMCRKKVGLTGFECRCGGLYCAVHRYSDKHDCTFDYRELGAQEIRRNNPVVVGEKIQKI